MLCAKPGQERDGVGQEVSTCGMLDFRVVGASARHASAAAGAGKWGGVS